MLEMIKRKLRSTRHAQPLRKKSSLRSSLNLLGLAASLLVLLTLVSCSRQADNPHADILLDSESDALEAKIVLTELRKGSLANALELLEMQIDTSVIMIDHSLSKASGPERASALDVLRSLKAYRVAHPRQREAGFQDLSKEEAKALVHASQQASHILSGLK